MLRVSAGFVASFSLCLLVFAAPGTALASDDQLGDVSLPPVHRDVIVEVDSTVATIVPLEQSARAGTRILYVNRCTGGETIKRGYNDSRQNTSSIINATTTFPEYPYGDAQWNQVMTEVRDILAPFDVTVTDVDPGMSDHTEIVACGNSFLGQNVLGVAPSACGVVENAIGYAFAEEHGSDPRQLAETIAHEAGHTWTLPHIYDCEDPMTYLGGCGDKYFQDAQLSCAELDGNQWVKVTCRCTGSTVNSYQTLQSVFGPAEPTPPTITILEPNNGAYVDAGFVVRPEIVDDQGVKEASLYIDGQLILTLTQGPYVFNAPNDLAEGRHTVEIRAADRNDAVGSAIIDVTRGTPPGQGEPGGFGGDCSENGDCNSGLCARSGDVSLCTETCTEGSCPDGFTCSAAGASSVCWPGSGGGDDPGGCAASTGAGNLPLALGFAFMLLFGVRRLRA
jgi:hypothetical protein